MQSGPSAPTVFSSKFLKVRTRRTRVVAWLGIVALCFVALAALISPKAAAQLLSSVMNQARQPASKTMQAKTGSQRPWLPARHSVDHSIPLLFPAQESEPTLTTDKLDYQPGEFVLISGSGFWPNEVVTLRVDHVDGPDEPGNGHEPWTVTADSFGSFFTSWFVDPDDSLGARFVLTAVGASSNLSTLAFFTDAGNPSGDLDQCGNGPAGSPVPCTGAAWQNGNLNQNQAHYSEGDSVPYRLRFQNLDTAISHTVTIEWDTTKSGKHALDYLTSFDRTETTANPCSGVAGCSLAGPKDLETIPVDANVTAGQNQVDDPPAGSAGGDDIAQIAGDFTLFNGTITGLSAYTRSGTYAGDSSTRITITFTASTTNPVLAWGGHIGTRVDWGLANSAIAISGSPYHMRFIDLDGSGGNQDRSLSASAVFFPVSLKIIKETNPDDAAFKTFNYTVTGNNLTAFGLAPPDGTTPAEITFSLTDGTTRTVTESDPAASSPKFALTSLTCSQTSGGLGTGTVTPNLGTRTVTINPVEGESITCTFVNEEFGKLKVIKHVINDNGGTNVASDFTLHVKSGGTDISGSPAAGSETGTTYSDLSAGANLVVSEAATPTGYTASFSGDCDSSGNVTIASGVTKTCTITNNDVAPKLTIIKHVINDNGGTAVAADFTLDSGGTNDSPDDFPGSETGTEVTLDAGSYAVTETGPSGYSRSDSADCSGTIAVGESKTCTVTNNDNAPKLTIIKHVINDNGGTAVAADFTLDSGGTNDSPDDFAGSETGTEVTLDAGSYAVTETGPSGYSRSDSADCSGTIAVGESKTCTVTNDDVAPKLTVIKHVINDNGGTAVAADFTLDSGGTNDSPDNFPGNEAGTEVTLDAGSYAVTETGPSGYARSDSADCSGTIAVGESKTCTVTNDDVAPKLTIIKHVINDNGGTAVAADFTLDSGGTNDSPDNFPGNEAGTEVTLDAGSYAVTESGPSGYSRSDSADCSGTIAVGESKTCTVTNDDIAPKLTVIKHVINDNGGTAVAADFTLDSGGTNDSPDNFPGNEAGTEVTLDAGSYAVTESGPSGYARSDSADCSGTIAVGESKTCTVTNDDVAPKLTVIKHVINDNGGTAVAADFTLDSGGTNDSPDNFPGNEAGTEVTLDAGSYAVTETGPSGYSRSDSADCSGTIAVGESKTCTVTNNDIAPKLTIIKHVINDNGGTAVAADFTLDSGGTNDSPDNFPGNEAGTEVTLDAGSYAVTESGPSGYARSDSADCSGTIAVGESKTCTVTNDDVAPKLTIIKHVINDNGGTAVAADFTLDSGGTNDSPDNFPGNEAGTEVTLDAGSYAVTETGPSGYSRSDSTECSGTIAVGESKTCTVTNDDVAPKLTIIKHVINDNGGTAVAADFTLDSGGTNDSPDNFPGNEAGTEVTLDAGSYAVTETGPSGYSRSDSADCSGTIAVGESKTCTVTNDDVAPKLTIIKHVINDNGGTAVAADFTLDSGGTNDSPDNFPGSETGTEVTLDAGSYAVTETGPSGYARSDSADCSGTIAVGESKTCTVTNNDISPTLTVNKVCNPAGDTGLFNLQIDTVTHKADATCGGPNGTTGAIPVNAGSHTVGETAGTGTSLSDYVTVIGGQCALNGSVSLALGENKTCTITNTRRGKIIVEKQTNPDNAPGNFTFTGTAAGTVSDNGTIEVPNLAPGTYTSTENNPTPAFDLTNITCDDGASATPSTVNVGTRTAYFKVDPGETVKCTFTNRQRGKVEVLKITNGGIHPELDIRFTLYRDGPDADPDLTGTDTQLEELTTLGDADGLLQFQEKLVPGTTYTICENPVPAGWTSLWTIGFTVNGNIVTPYNPNANDPVPSDLGIRCIDFTVNPGQTKQFEVHNDFPGGDPRTIGYWKNWNRCTGGGQAANAAKNGGAAAGFFILEDLLPQQIGDFNVINCQQGVFILGKQDQSGKSKSSDAAYELAAQLLAAKLNLAAGAETCTAVQNAVIAGQNLLANNPVNFTGSGDYLTSKQKNLATLRAQALSLAATLDAYNNGNLCP